MALPQSDKRRAKAWLITFSVLAILAALALGLRQLREERRKTREALSPLASRLSSLEKRRAVLRSERAKLSEDDLLALLGDESAEVRAKAAALLGERKVEKARRALQLMAQFDRRMEVRVVAKQALKALGGEATIPAKPPPRKSSSPKDERRKAKGESRITNHESRKLPPVPKEELEAIANLLAHDDARLRLSGVHAATNLPAVQAIPLLKRALHDTNAGVQQMAAHGLAQKGKAGIDILLASIKNADSSLQAAVLYAFSGTKDPRALKELEKGLLSGNEQVRAAAQEALGRCGEVALPILRRALHHQSALIRDAAVQALSSHGSQKALQMLIQVVRSEQNEVVRANAIGALGAHQYAGALPVLKSALYSHHPIISETAAMALGQLGKEGLKLLKDALSSSRREVRLAAAHALSSYGDQEAAKLLNELAKKSSDMHTRIVCLQALARGGDKAALGQLVQLMGHDDAKVHLKAKAALVGLREQSVPKLLDALRDSNPRIRAGAAHLLGIMGVSEAREALSQLTKDEDESVRQAAQSALKSLPKPPLE